MAHNVIVLVSDLDNAIRGELNVLDSVEEATRLVETLIESGFEQERVRVFLGDEMQMAVRHRPVVSLAAEVTGEAVKEEEESPSTATVRAASLVLGDVTVQPVTRNGKRSSVTPGSNVLSPA